jgi:protein involved in polysaccharide export with SLBB domain
MKNSEGKATKVISLPRGLETAAFGFALFLFAGCGAAAARGDLAGAGASGGMSAEQCSAQAEITDAALHNGPTDASYVIQPGDELTIDFYLSPEFNDDVVVRPDGKAAFRLIGDVQAAGLSPQSLAARLDERYSSELLSPQAAVHVKNMPSRQIYVEGEVTKPTALALEPGMTILQAIAVAGGLTDNAARNAVIIRRDACGVPQGSLIDLKSATKDPAKGEDVALLPRDTIVVPRSAVANVNLFVKQYIRDNLPITPYMSFVPL